MGVSLREYARMRGLDKESVRLAYHDGRLPNSVTKKENGRYDIDPELADKEWKENTNPAKQNNTKNKVAQPPSMAQARAVREMYAARLTQLEYEERSGLLCKVEDVKLASFKSARLTRDAMLNIPARVVNEITALIGGLEAAKSHEILLILQREIHSALEQEAGTNGPS
ncbi:MAG: hypothetical protein CL844_05160 [Crocinitomicaceae bacterium]|nr:hypothetical protein [Crocinitomicaceae bacterium]|tara:strand:- start:30390 stop:30896 length:507 start_codon:yes stop_codon:yes gene_type:complete